MQISYTCANISTNTNLHAHIGGGREHRSARVLPGENERFLICLCALFEGGCSVSCFCDCV